MVRIQQRFAGSPEGEKLGEGGGKVGVNSGGEEPAVVRGW